MREKVKKGIKIAKKKMGEAKDYAIRTTIEIKMGKNAFYVKTIGRIINDKISEKKKNIYEEIKTICDLVMERQGVEKLKEIMEASSYFINKQETGRKKIMSENIIKLLSKVKSEKKIKKILEYIEKGEESEKKNVKS